MAITLKSILDKGINVLKSFQSKKVETAVGIDIGTSSIKVVQLKKEGGKAVLETYGALSLGPYADKSTGEVTNLETEKIVDALKTLLEEAGVSTKNAVTSIPATASLIFLLELPSLIKKSELPTIIPTEARKYIPVPISEVSLDWFIVPKREDLFEGEENEEEPDAKKGSKTEVLVVAIPKDTINKFNDIATQSGVGTSSFEHEVFSSIRSTFGHELSSVALLDFGASKTKLSIVERGIVKSFHLINKGSQDITNSLSKSLQISFDKAEEMKRTMGLSGGDEDNSKIREIIELSTDYIFSEANNVVLNYEKKYNKTISKVILTGGGSLLKGFFELATSNFRSKVELADPFEKAEAPSFLEPTLKSTGPEFSVSLGLALSKLG